MSLLGAWLAHSVSKTKLNKVSQKCQISKSKSRGKPQIIQLRMVFLHLLKSNSHIAEEILGDGKNLVCFDLFSIQKHVD